MTNDYKIKVQDVTKEYDLFKTQSEKLKSFFALSKNVPHFWALMGISFEIPSGETLGIIGVNGSGKSTISNIISGIIPQTTGYVDVRGDTSIVAISAGLRKNLTGRENIRLKSLMQGLTNKQIDNMMDDIISFADIGDFVDQPVKSYSTGMRSRLGFSIAVHVNPDILIIDEALSVGDDTFYQKCLDKIADFKKQGKTIIFVSHSLHQIRLLCDRVAWINYGVLRDIGPTMKVTKEYQHFTKKFKSLSKKNKKAFQHRKRSIRENFNVHNYQRQIAKQVKNHHPHERRIRSKVKKLFYGSVISEKMPFSSRILTVMILILIILLCVVNISGYGFDYFLNNPTSVGHPSRILKVPNNQTHTNRVGSGTTNK